MLRAHETWLDARPAVLPYAVAVLRLLLVAATERAAGTAGVQRSQKKVHV
jgi:hypothetical protein